MNSKAIAFAAVLAIASDGSSLSAAETDEFASRVAPILAAHCHKCHAAEKPKSGLDLTSAGSLLRGGESGPAVVPGQAEKSLLVEHITDGSMPPEGEVKLSANELAAIRHWIDSGAHAALPAPVVSNSATSAAARDFWAFRKLNPPAVPHGKGSAPRTSVDAFIGARLAEAGLRLAPPADRLTLLRRVTLDLVGLPPTPEEVEAFAADDRPDAYERLVDRLLASPAFGERWGRHWLDAAGYSDITGGDNDAGIIKLAEGKWKYRDYVVRSFNADKPYDRFLVEQLAGDELVDWRQSESLTPKMQELLIATGFLRSAADDTDEKELTTPDILHGVLQRTSEVVANNLLGLTLGCAKCHDHKYEPISQQEYYRLIAAFSPTFNPKSWVPPKSRALADIAPKRRAEAESHNAELDRQVAELSKLQAATLKPARTRVLEARLAKLPEGIRGDVKAAHETEVAKRSEVQKYLAEKFKPELTVSEADAAGALDAAEKAVVSDAGRRIAALKGERRTWGTIQAAYDVGPPPETNLLRRGNHETPGTAVEPGFLTVLCSTDQGPHGTSVSSSVLSPSGPTSGRRLALARWLTDWEAPSGGLAARVMVNRVWQHLFGRGIVETSENLGVSGAKPSHAELLEWLACHFVAEGRQLKPLIKLLMTSDVYRQASSAETSVSAAGGSSAVNVDPANHLLWHMPLRRLEAEIVRDAILAAGGRLDVSLGGPPLGLEVRPDGMVVIKADGNASNAAPRRSLYVLARRNYHLSMLNVFDQPAMSMNCPNRQQSAVVLQSLTMLNDEFVLAGAQQFAERVRTRAGEDQAQQIRFAFRIALARDPSEQEAAWSAALLTEQVREATAGGQSTADATRAALVHLCHMLLNTNEFLYVP